MDDDDNAADRVRGRRAAEHGLGSHALTVEVSDTGPGVPAEATESIFTGGWSTKHDASGRPRGIGLALVRQLVDQLGGTITVEPGRGAVFRVTLPVAAVTVR